MERSVSWGEAVTSSMPFGPSIVATDRHDAELVARCERALEVLRHLVIPRFRVRLVAEACTEGDVAIVIVSDGERSIVTTPEHFERDLALLARAGEGGKGAPLQAEWEGLPLLWTNGSAAVLLHESFGHPREHGMQDAPLPGWLHVDVALASRRASFRDVPLLRIASLETKQIAAPWKLPAERIDVELVDGGSWDPLTDAVTLRISSSQLMKGGHEQKLAPFTLVAQRGAIHRSFRGARGEPVRYPGVICAREGQELFVASHAPLLLTDFR